MSREHQYIRFFSLCWPFWVSVLWLKVSTSLYYVQGGSNMTGTDLCVNKPHCAAANRRYRGAWNNALWSNSSLEKTSRPLKFTTDSNNTLATPRQDWTGSNPSRREGGGCGFTLSRSHSCCAVRLVYTQISPGHIWATLYVRFKFSKQWVEESVCWGMTLHHKVITS